MKTSPTILGIETSTDACSVALLCNDEIILRHEIAPREHVGMILSKIDELFLEANKQIGDCDAIAYGQGPGSFTGLRIAASVTQGLALGANIPVIAISSLQVLAQTAMDTLKLAHKFKDGYIIVASDARIQEVYWGCYKAVVSELVVPIIDAQLTAPDEINLPQVVVNAHSYGVGNAWRIYTDGLSSCSMKLTEVANVEYPSGAALLKLAKKAFVEGKLLRPHEALPVYLRDKVTQ